MTYQKAAIKERYKKDNKHNPENENKTDIGEKTPQPSLSQDRAYQSTSHEEDAKLLNKKVVATCLKKALDKKGKRVKMSSKECKSREEVMAAREAKKQMKQKSKPKETCLTIDEVKAIVKERKKSNSETSRDDKPGKERTKSQSDQRSKDEVDKAAVASSEIQTANTGASTVQTEKNEKKVLGERLSKKTAKQAQKKDKGTSDIASIIPGPTDTDMTIKDVVEALRNIKEVADEVKGITAEVKALDLKGKKNLDENTLETGKSKAELKAERRAKQEAQRAAKQAATEPVKLNEPIARSKEIPKTTKLVADAKTTAKTMSPKPKTAKKVLQQNRHRVSWFGQEYNDNAQSLKIMPVNSHIHPAFIKLGVQLSTRVVTGSNARCVALLDALKKMTKDYMLPARTEFSRGLDSHLTETIEFLASMRQSTASEKNAIKFYRHHLMQLPNNVNEFEAKKTLQDEIDRYIREQIDMAGEAISADVMKKIAPGDVILTYGYSSLVARCLIDAAQAGIPFRCCVCGSRGAESGRGARELTRRLRVCALPVDLVDITSLGAVMQTVNKVLLGASCILNNGSVLGAAGTALVARQARMRNVPVLVACETHKFSERVQTDAFVYNELGDPDDLNDVCNENWELKDWRSKPLAILNLAYDVTPPSLVTAVVTELAILPCTSAPVVLRFRGTAYGI